MRYIYVYIIYFNEGGARELGEFSKGSIQSRDNIDNFMDGMHTVHDSVCRLSRFAAGKKL